jgi:hypothetical protein
VFLPFRTAIKSAELDPPAGLFVLVLREINLLSMLPNVLKKINDLEFLNQRSTLMLSFPLKIAFKKNVLISLRLAKKTLNASPLSLIAQKNVLITLHAGLLALPKRVMQQLLISINAFKTTIALIA